MRKKANGQKTPQFPVDWGKISKDEAQRILGRIRGLSEEVRGKLMKITSS